MVINHDFRFLAPICICTLGISKYLLIFGFVTFHILDIWKNLYLQIEKTHFQKPTLFVWWCFTEKCHALIEMRKMFLYFIHGRWKGGRAFEVFWTYNCITQEPDVQSWSNFACEALFCHWKGACKSWGPPTSVEADPLNWHYWPNWHQILIDMCKSA